MKKAFTLVEMLIVVVVIVTLMTIAFRITGIASSARARNVTISRMQRLENALSGYYAAFGSYPPVGLYYSRNVYMRVDQRTGDQEGTEEEELKWPNVRWACRAQPVSASFPFSKKKRAYVDACSKVVVKRCNSSEERYKGYADNSDILGGGFSSLDNPNMLSGWNTKESWHEIKVFQFGVMSFLLPRYMFMLDGIIGESGSGTEANILDDCKQWGASNRYPANPNNGSQITSWGTVMDPNKASLLKRMPSQSVCARWMPNFEDSLVCNDSHDRFFGVHVRETDGNEGTIPIENPEALAQLIYDDGGKKYILDRITMVDGWGNDFYYYSPEPFQSYRIWSAGQDGKTFPPWYPIEKLKNDSDKRLASEWLRDDIMQMNN